MEKNHRQQISRLFGSTAVAKTSIANIKDTYPFMDPELITQLKTEIETLVSQN